MARGVHPPTARSLRARATQIVLLGVAIAAGWNTLNFFLLQASGTIRSGTLVPLSLLILIAVAIMMTSTSEGSRERVRGEGLGTAFFVVFLCVLFPLSQMAFFGRTDYRRPADAVVVFGAGVYPDGRPSDALKDRMRTATELYNDGLVETVVLSGGPGMGAVHETEAMRHMALELGVEPRDVLVDPDGLDTDSTARNTSRMLSARGASRVLVVSHFYHLPRIKLAYQREGLDVYTVPARESYTLTAPWYVTREVAALWLYYVRPLIA